MSLPGSNLEKVGVVLPRGGDGEWDNGMVESPAVWYDTRMQTYCMVYTGYGRRLDAPAGEFSYHTVTIPQIGMATSDDLVTWTKFGDGPILSPSGNSQLPDSHGMAGPVVVPPEVSGHEMYYLLYFGTTAEGYEAGRKTMNIATSIDGLSWTPFSGNPIVEPDCSSEQSAWRNEAIWHPNVVKRGDTFYLFFNTSGTHDGLAEEFIGFATSLDMLTWTVDDAHSPVLTGSRTPSSWDSSGRAGDPSIFRVGDMWYMAYYSWDNIRSQDGMAVTTDGEFPLGWRPIEGNPILRFGSPGAFDAQHAGKPFVFRTSDRHYHYYTAVDDDGCRQIALAEGNYL